MSFGQPDFSSSLREAIRLYGRLGAGTDRRIPKDGHALSYRRVLIELLDRPGATDVVVANRLGVARSFFSRTIGRLLEEGLVDREPVPQHQGQRRLSLSEKGRALAELYLRELQQAVKTEFESMESADQYPLLGALQLTETEGVETVQDGHIRVLPSKDADFAWFLNEMSKIKLRKGQVGLFSEAVSIVNQNLQDTYAAELRLTAQRRLKPVGMCLLLSHPNRTDLELAALYVDPVHRQLGAATAMVERAISNAARLTYLKIYAATGENESDMRKLLERCGFRKERGSRRIMRYGQPETVYRFIKDLPMA